MEFIKKYFAVILFILSFLLFFRVFFITNFPDLLQNYYSPGFLLSGVNPYTFNKLAFFPTVYPPVAIMLFFPLSLFPLVVAEKIWLVASFIFLLLSIQIIFIIFNKRLFSKLGLIVLSFCFLSFPVKFTLGMGQINNLILLLTVLSIYFLKKDKKIISATMLSLSLSIKFFPIFLPIYFLIKKDIKYLLFLILTFLGFNFMVYLIFPDLVKYFYTNVVFQFINGWKTDYYNQSLTGFVGRIFLDGQLREVVRGILTLIIISVSLYGVLKSRFNKDLLYLSFSFLIVANLLKIIFLGSIILYQWSFRLSRSCFIV